LPFPDSVNKIVGRSERSFAGIIAVKLN